MQHPVGSYLQWLRGVLLEIRIYSNKIAYRWSRSQRELEEAVEVSPSELWMSLEAFVETRLSYHQEKSLIVAKCLIISLSFPTISRLVFRLQKRGVREHGEEEYCNQFLKE